ncbi:MAG: Hsp70 family protein [Bdellovibrionota bacterium]
MKNQSRYIVGIDLGTTNCALSYYDTLNPNDGIKKLEILQWENENQVIKKDTLPSFCYIPPKSDIKKNRFSIESIEQQNSEEEKESNVLVAGSIARQFAATNSDRVIHSAKSWLCHGKVNRNEKILPWNSDEIIGSKRFSPVEVSAHLLKHLRDVWNAEIARFEPSYRLESQTIIVTVPASFDEVAQKLTLTAISMAGFNLEKVTLIEEPQAAFYFWLENYKKSHIKNKGYEFQSTSNKVILVCDIGGGTTDFSLFNLNRINHKNVDEALKDIEIERFRVSDHILLGGDNIDLKIAYLLEEKLLSQQTVKTNNLSSKQWSQLIAQTRTIKENLLSQKSNESPKDSTDSNELHVSVSGAGSSLFKSTISASIGKEELMEVILAGFYPECENTDTPEKSTSALQEWNLPYAQDSRITRHLASFLAGTKVDGIIYTGGSLKPHFIQNHLTKLIENWQKERPIILENPEMDLAVCLGATSYGLAKHQKRHLLKGGYPRSIFVEVIDQHQHRSLVCILPKGTEHHHNALIIDSLDLKAHIGTPVRFQLFYSNKRTGDKLGDIVEYTENEFHLLPPLQTRLETKSALRDKNYKSNKIDVGLKINLKGTGLLEISCYEKCMKPNNHAIENPENFQESWKLEFNLQDSSGSHQSNLASDELSEKSNSIDVKNRIALAISTINSFYGKKKVIPHQQKSPSQLIKLIEDDLALQRQEWDATILRSMWPMLHEGRTRRGRSSAHEMSWLNLSGYVLRPGYGNALDEFRVNDLWDIFNHGLSFPKEAKVKNQWWIMWRRVAGGLNKNQQDQLFSKIIPSIRKEQEATAEMYMLAGSLELVDMDKKVQLGNYLTEQITRGKKNAIDQKIWALARLSSRIPLYGGPDCIIRPHFIEKWAQQLKPLKCEKLPYKKLNQFYAQAGRKIGDRELDIGEEARSEFLCKLKEASAQQSQIIQVENITGIDIETKISYLVRLYLLD